MVSPDTLYYTFSTIPQVLGALVAIIAAFVHFRIIRLQDYLIGDGQSVLDRQNEEGYRLDLTQKKRLRDAVSRKNKYEIKDVIRILSDAEYKEGLTKKQRPNGLQYLYEDRFYTAGKRFPHVYTNNLYIVTECFANTGKIRVQSKHTISFN